VSIIERQTKIRMVLVNTTHPGNIGGAARAMKNMGLLELYLVQPKEYPAPRAVWRAAGAGDVLANAKVVDSVDQAIEGCGLVVGTSARGRRIPWPLMNPRECGKKMWAEASMHDVALLFGREDRGLTNSELHKCNYHVNIPSNPDYSSLNLATAVQVLAYEIRMASLVDADDVLSRTEEWDQPLATSDELELFHDHLARTMAGLNFYDPDNPKQLITRMRRLFNRSRMDKMEVSMLRGLLSAADRKGKG
jgi:tRNA (cytidine32/uridine32-2'-O)-methyltransferase